MNSRLSGTTLGQLWTKSALRSKQKRWNSPQRTCPWWHLPPTFRTIVRPKRLLEEELGEVLGEEFRCGTVSDGKQGPSQRSAISAVAVSHPPAVMSCAHRNTHVQSFNNLTDVTLYIQRLRSARAPVGVITWLLYLAHCSRSSRYKIPRPDALFLRRHTPTCRLSVGPTVCQHFWKIHKMTKCKTYGSCLFLHLHFHFVDILSFYNIFAARLQPSQAASATLAVVRCPYGVYHVRVLHQNE